MFADVTAPVKTVGKKVYKTGKKIVNKGLDMAAKGVTNQIDVMERQDKIYREKARRENARGK
jgi:chaperonin cofactor prefoldin